mmetsp:Transcript_13232/g.55595  ORF Transcript_13232/g.55595 Transcript_13232/m.55595 type:complete len:444 (-) Transcript_13232:1276-2607(-)
MERGGVPEGAGPRAQAAAHAEGGARSRARGGDGGGAREGRGGDSRRAKSGGGERRRRGSGGGGRRPPPARGGGAAPPRRFLVAAVRRRRFLRGENRRLFPRARRLHRRRARGFLRLLLHAPLLELVVQLLLARLRAPCLFVFAEHRPQVRGDASPKRGHHAALDAVPALEDGNHASLAVRVRDLAQLLGEPLVVRLLNAEVHGSLDLVLGVRVEPGGDENQVGLERRDGGQGLPPPDAAPRRAALGALAEPLHADVDDPGQGPLRGAVVLGLRHRERVVHDALLGPRGGLLRFEHLAPVEVSVVGGGTRAGVEVHALASPAVAVHGGEEHLVVVRLVQPGAVRGDHDRAVAVRRGELELGRRRRGVLHNRLGAVAVVHVEVDDGDTAKRVPVHAARVRRAERDVVQQAEAVRARADGVAGRGHGAVWAGVVAGRTHRAKHLLG